MAKNSYDIGIIAYEVKPGEYQRAIDLAGRTYRQRYGQPPTIVALPRKGADDGLNTYTMARADTYAPPGTVIVGGRVSVRTNQLALPMAG